MATHDGLLAWRFLLGDNGWRAHAWLAFSQTDQNELAVLPRLTKAPARPPASFVAMLEKGVDPRALLPRLVLLPDDLARHRVKPLREQLTQTYDYRPPPMTVPLEIFVKATSGLREHGRLGAVDATPDEWVHAALRIAFDETSRAQEAATHYIDSSKAYQHIADAEQRLAGNGVLPFAAWPGGRLPNNWSAAPQFLSAIREWAAIGQQFEQAFAHIRSHHLAPP